MLGELPLPAKGRWVRAVGFSPDGLAVAAGSQRGAWLWNVQTKGVIQSFSLREGEVTKLCFTPDGASLVSAGGYEDGTIRIWDVPTGKLTRALEGALARNRSPCLSQDGRRLAVIAADRVQVWDLSTLRLLTQGPEAEEPFEIGCVALSPDGRLLVVGWGDNNGVGGSIELHSLEGGGQPQVSLPFNRSSVTDDMPGAVTEAKFSADGKVLATFHQNSFRQTTAWRYWEASSGARLDPPKPLPAWADRLNQGKRKVDVAPDGSLRVFDAAGRLRASLYRIHFRQWSRRFGMMMPPQLTTQSLDWLWQAVDGHWCGSPGAERVVAWRINGQLKPAEAFPALKDTEAVRSALRSE